MSQREIQDLVEQLQQAQDAYYNGDPVMSDAEFDALEDELRELDPKNAYFQRVGAKAKKTKWKKVKHSAPMGSLLKVQTEDEFTKWMADVSAKIKTAASSGDIDKADSAQVVSEKLDGISISLRYEDGKLVSAVTRGDGITGEEITRNVLLMQGVPKKARDLTGYVRGEIVLKKSDHKKHVPEYKNPRNAASGIAKRESDPEPCKHLTVICYQLLSERHKITDKAMEFKLLDAIGFTVPSWTLCKTSTEIEKIYADYVKGRREKLDYDIDGLVVECNSLAVMEHLGEHDGRPKGARAFKFPHEEQATRLRDIVWQVGNSGRVTPVAYFDTVSLAGASVSQASLHNVDNIQRLATRCPQTLLGMGDKILVSRRNDVIPYVEKVLRASSNARFAVPTDCPSCGTKLVRSQFQGAKPSRDDTVLGAVAKLMVQAQGAYLLCPNGSKCPAQRSGAVKRWVNKLDVKDWGDTLIDALVESGMVKSPADLYGLDEAKLAALTLSGKKVGDSTAKKVMRNLRAKMELRIADFVGSLGIDMWGRSMTQTIVDAGLDTLEKMEDATVAQISAIPGVGDTKAVKFVEGFRRSRKLIDELLAVGVTVKKPITGGKLSGISFCFTGVRDPAFADEILEAGGTVKSSVGKGLTYLVAKDPKSTSGKAKKARAQGTEVISLEEAKALL